jgi:hypothetical protein
VSEGHSPPGEQRGSEKSGHRKKVSEGGLLSDTHFLKSAERATSHDSEREREGKGYPLPGGHRKRDKSGLVNKTSEDHSLPGEPSGRDKSGQRKNERAKGTHSLSVREGQVRTLKAREREGLTNWRGKREG